MEEKRPVALKEDYYPINKVKLVHAYTYGQKYAKAVLASDSIDFNSLTEEDQEKLLYYKAVSYFNLNHLDDFHRIYKELENLNPGSIFLSRKYLASLLSQR